MASVSLHAIGSKEASSEFSSINKDGCLTVSVGQDQVSIYFHNGKFPDFLRDLREVICDAMESMGEEPPRHMPGPPEEDDTAPLSVCYYCNGRGHQVYHSAGGGFSHDLCQACNGKGSK